MPSVTSSCLPSFCPPLMPSLCPLFCPLCVLFWNHLNFPFCALFPFDLPVLFERFIFHNLCPHSDQPPWQLYLNAHFTLFALFVPSCLLLMCILNEFFPPDLKLHSSQSYPKTSCCKLVWFFRISWSAVIYAHCSQIIFWDFIWNYWIFSPKGGEGVL